MKTSLDPAQEAYAATAGHYDHFTAHHDYELWLGNLLPALEREGLQGTRLLDVACGTGKSFLPMLERGWEVTAADISPEMLELAAAKCSERVELIQADMRRLPRLGSFDLVWCLGDAVNYLLNPDGLTKALAAMGANLAESGLVLFDTNTLAMYRGFFASTEVHRLEQGRLIWRGKAAPDSQPGAEALAVLTHESADGRLLSTAMHRQRHFPRAQVEAALGAAGLRPLAVYGHGYDAELCQPLDEAVHTKAIYIAGK